MSAEFRVPVWSPVTVQVMEADAPPWETLVFDGIDDVDVVKVTVAFGAVDIVARGRGARATCPDCGHYSERTHGSYQRRLRDLPLGELRVVILLKGPALRLWRDGLFESHVRQAVRAADLSVRAFHLRLDRVLECLGLALAGRAGARLAAQLGLGAGRMTLRRRVMALPDPQFNTPRALLRKMILLQ